MDKVNAIELEAWQCGFDPAAPCPTIMNHTSIRVTCRKYSHHSSFIKSYLQTQFPSTVNPALSDLHISLANRDHLQSYL
ncbi:hypothetical protein BDN67DRAFT_917321 [Paxillus ammoniavirescens]|nr:hypothetical protein BDN67DRAFT_917321 [Paxillus ammoniavirescens]